MVESAQIYYLCKTLNRSKCRDMWRSIDIPSEVLCFKTALLMNDLISSSAVFESVHPLTNAGKDVGIPEGAQPCSSRAETHGKENDHVSVACRLGALA